MQVYVVPEVVVQVDTAVAGQVVPVACVVAMAGTAKAAISMTMRNPDPPAMVRFFAVTFIKEFQAAVCI